MSTPDGKDYGKAGDKALVPGTLRAFRHFALDTTTGRLMPMSWKPPGAHAGRNMPAYKLPWELGGEPQVAECHRFNPYAAIFAKLMGLPEEDHSKKVDHVTPSVECSCGFYGHYDQDTDFYPSYRWGRVYARLAGQKEVSHIIGVRGVVEMSGTVVMGTKGVRAQKARIIALAPDWEKQVKPTYEDIFNFRMSAKYRDIVRKTDPQVWKILADDHGLDEDIYDSPFEEIFDEVEKEGAWALHQVNTAAMSYGATFHGNAAEMYAAYPAEDVSHLVDRTPPPEPEWETDGGVAGVPLPNPPLANMPRPQGSITLSVNGQTIANMTPTQAAALSAQVNGYAQQINQSFRQFGKSVQAASDGVQQALKGIRSDFVILDEVIEHRHETNFERAMRLKRDRKAPPGTGIDRRRGRLR